MILTLSACGPQGCFPRFADLKTEYPHVIYHGPKKPSEVVIKKNPPVNWVPLSQVSKAAQGAILVSEDWAFYHHPGYDEKQIKEAIEDSLESGKLKRGASTITQQVVRNIYLSKKKSITRKVRELWMATKIEKVLGKKKILELYLNIAEWGEGVFGIQEDAHVYFDKNASQLTAKEGAFLAMLLPSPKKYAISFHQKQLTPFARRIVKSVLGKMVQAGYITAEQKDAEWATPLKFEKTFQPHLPSDDESIEEEVPGHDVDEDLDDSAEGNESPEK